MIIFLTAACDVFQIEFKTKIIEIGGIRGVRDSDPETFKLF